MTEIFIQKNNEGERKIALVENGILLEYYEEEDKETRKEGNIYIGIVKDIVEGMQSAFVDIGTEKNSFIHLKDVLPKVDEKKEKLDTSVSIKKILKPNQKILVQVKKDSNDKKGARVSTHINLPSKYIVFMPNTDIVTISQKIEDEKEQERLLKIVKENLSSGNGAIIRTSAEGKEKEVIEDIKNIEEKWEKITKINVDLNSNKPQLLYKSEDIVEKMLIDLADRGVQKVTVNDSIDYNEITKIKNENKEYKNLQIVVKSEGTIFDLYDLEQQIHKINNRKIWLKCGGFITIDKTEALTAIDVNSGKFTGKKDMQKNNTIFKVNKEATIEIAKQIRLRNISGIIVIDYIDMQRDEERKEIIELLEQNLKQDRSKTQVIGFTKLDLLEMTRKKL